MNRCIAAFLLLLLSSFTNAFAQDCFSLSALEKLTGHWEEKNKDQITQEKWQRVSSNSFEGEGVVFDNLGKKKNFETLRLVEMSGEIFYIAKVSDNNFPTSFRLTSCIDTKFTFENPDHDFPQKISYNFLDLNRLLVQVSSNQNEGFSIEFIRSKTSD